MASDDAARRRFGLSARPHGREVLDQETSDLRRDHGGEGRTCIGDAPDRERVQLFGILRTVTLQPRGGVPALQAELADGTGSLTLVWLGRRSIRGISAGRSISVTGRAGVQDGVRVMFNPRYELRP
ncbi:OB-fold nucleic acid binding domain-containing protein [Nocardioides sp. ChNu-153]|nr:OB-fold nucleic acid binding domain-containing protein [Nocardioides sp. ChNu-99]MDN7121222.1 OB-fold nucleic acid binding domain-containing protein [Nocardioides sp. ChNu-153]